MTQPEKIQSAPGIKRDGTRLEGEQYVDGQWVRFERGRPKKMGGYNSATGNIPELAYGMSSFSEDGQNFIHIGQESTVQQAIVNNSTGTLSSLNVRTPDGFTSDSDYLWQFDVFYDQTTPSNQLMAHPGLNLTDIDNSTATEVFYGTASDTTTLVGSNKSVSGGCVALGPFFFVYGSDGLISYSVANDPYNTDGIAYSDAFITPQKVVKGLPLRGAGSGPAGLFWSLDSLIRATYTGDVATWSFDTLASDISILSSQGVIEYDGVYYWAGVDRFLMFNGVVRDVPNPSNTNWFYDNLNFTHRQKCFAYKVPRYGELWWCYPRGSATECTHAVIYNVREQTWYDTELPDEGRTAGIFAKVYNKPFMIDNTATASTGYTLWQHETGTDKVVSSVATAVPSFFETAELSLLNNQQAQSKSLHVARIEPDFVQSGDMTVTVSGRQNARAPEVEGEVFTFNDSATNGDEETVKVREVRRLMSFKFASNVAGGHYEAGETYAHIEPADGRIET